MPVNRQIDNIKQFAETDSGMFFRIRERFVIKKRIKAPSIFIPDTMKRLLNLYAQKPFLLDLTVVLLLLPLFCHFIVALHSRRTFFELIVMRGYLIPMAVSYGCGLVAIGYIRWVNEVLGKRYGVDDDWEQRALLQLKWNIIPPVAFIVGVITIYFAYYGENIFSRGYLRRDIFWVFAGVILLVLIYHGQHKQRYRWKRRQEREEYERLMAEEVEYEQAMLVKVELPEVKPTIWVLDPMSRKDAVGMPIDAIAVVDRHNDVTTVSTWDGQRFEWPMPALKMKAFLQTHGFTWFGQHYALTHAAVETSEGVGQKGRRLLLRKGIVVNNEKQVLTAKLDGLERTYLVFHKNIAKAVGDWFENGH